MASFAVQESRSVQHDGQSPDFENNREREFYRYYRPIRELGQSSPLFCDMKNELSMESHVPSPSPDPALTAFCQLGALRMNTRRSLMFFFDTKYSYVLAEATRSLSLNDGATDCPEDNLWLGHTIMPRGVSVCEYTVLLPARSPQDLRRPRADAEMVQVINDLTEDARFYDRPFVTGGPRARFYAGVPITTAAGINIGAYCVLDDRPRDGLSATETTFMCDMACTIGIHLEMLRSAAEHRLGAQMITGLGAFIDGASSLRDEVEQKSAKRETAVTSPLSVTRNSTKPKFESHEPTQNETGYFPSFEASHKSSAEQRPSSKSSSSSKSPGMTARPFSSGRSTSNQSAAPISAHDSTLLELRATYQRAAHVVREAVSADGVQFLDANFGPATSLVGSPTSGSTSSSTQSSGSGTPSTACSTPEESVPEISKPPVLSEECSVLSTSCDSLPRPISKRLLRRLLQRYRGGKIWFFDENEGSDSDSNRESESGSETGSGSDVIELAQSVEQVTLQAPGAKRKSRQDDRQEIIRAFPGARSVCFVGMWDHSRQRWHAASFSWTYSPFRHFSDDFDVKYMTAFCDVLLVELQRLEAMRSDRAKSDFISTISHELRSPLHGILGSVELLHALPDDPLLSSSDLISQVEVCSRTLLDVIDHLLDYSGINQLSRSGLKSAVRRNSRLTGTQSAAGQGVDGVLDQGVDLGRITEEVVEAALYSFCFSRDRDLILERNVAIILDIDDKFDWACDINLGAWKRICINLVSNALKYTNEGHINIRLRGRPASKGEKSFTVVFDVTDTGCGMSREFLENQLFTPFTQENSFAEGTGLGLNLVAKIVRKWGGHIDVKSEKGTGSSFSVSLPCQSSRRDSLSPPVRSPLGNLDAARLTVGLLDLPKHDSKSSQKLVLASIGKMLSMMDIKQIQLSIESREIPSIAVITESSLRSLLESSPEAPSAMSEKSFKTPIIVICDSVISARTFTKSELQTLTSGHAELILQPVGPHRLQKAIASCMQNTGQCEEQSVSLNLEPATSVNQSGQIGGIPTEHRKQKSKRADEQPAITSNNAINRPVLRRSKTAFDSHGSKRSPGKTLNGTMNGKSLDLNGAAEDGGDANLSLLLVDDNMVNIKILATFADRTGYPSYTAVDGQKAVDVFSSLRCTLEDDDGKEPASRDVRPLVILMDINMPNVDGYEATKQIRSLERKYRLDPSMIIGLSGLGNEAARQSAIQSGMDLFLTKPVRLHELKRVLDNLGK